MWGWQLHPVKDPFAMETMTETQNVVKLWCHSLQRNSNGTREMKEGIINPQK